MQIYFENLQIPCAFSFEFWLLIWSDWKLNRHQIIDFQVAIEIYVESISIDKWFDLWNQHMFVHTYFVCVACHIYTDLNMCNCNCKIKSTSPLNVSITHFFFFVSRLSLLGISTYAYNVCIYYLLTDSTKPLDSSALVLFISFHHQYQTSFCDLFLLFFEFRTSFAW